MKFVFGVEFSEAQNASNAPIHENITKTGEVDQTAPVCPSGQFYPVGSVTEVNQVVYREPPPYYPPPPYPGNSLGENNLSMIIPSSSSNSSMIPASVSTPIPTLRLNLTRKSGAIGKKSKVSKKN